MYLILCKWWTDRQPGTALPTHAQPCLHTLPYHSNPWSQFVLSCLSPSLWRWQPGVWQDALNKEGARPIDDKIVGLLFGQSFANLQELSTCTTAENKCVTNFQLLHRLGCIEVSIIGRDHCPLVVLSVKGMSSSCLDGEVLALWSLQEELTHGVAGALLDFTHRLHAELALVVAAVAVPTAVAVPAAWAAAAAAAAWAAAAAAACSAATTAIRTPPEAATRTALAARPPQNHQLTPSSFWVGAVASKSPCGMEFCPIVPSLNCWRPSRSFFWMPDGTGSSSKTASKSQSATSSMSW